MRAVIVVLLALMARSAWAQEEPKPCRIEGTVKDALTGEPLRKAVVQIRSKDNSGYQTLSSAEGTFRFIGIKPGEYTLVTERPGYTVFVYGAMGADYLGEGTRIPLQQGETRSGIQIKLQPQSVISGKVLDEAGEPTYRATVFVAAPQWQRGRRLLTTMQGAQTNDLGEYRLVNLRPGTYYLYAQPMTVAIASDPGQPERMTVPTFYPDRNTPVTIAAGQQLSGIDFRLRSAPAFHLRGKVAAPPGTPSFNTTIGATPVDKHWQNAPGGAAGQLRRDGSFDLAGLTPGAYELRAELFQMRGPATLGLMTVQVGSRDLNGVVLLPSMPVELTGVVQREAGATVPLTVRAAPLDNLHLRTQSAQLEPDGSFRLFGLVPGRFALQVSGGAPGEYVQSVLFRQKEVRGGLLDLTSGAGGELQITLAAGAGKVSGTVKEMPAVNAAALLVAEQPGVENQTVLSAPIDPAGRFSLANVAPGRYALFAVPQANPEMWDNPDLLREMQSAGLAVEVPQNGDVQAQPTLLAPDAVELALKRLGM